MKKKIIIISSTSGFKTLCHLAFRYFRKFDSIGWIRIERLAFIANTFYMNGLWLASSYALVAFHFRFLLLFSIYTY